MITSLSGMGVNLGYTLIVKHARFYRILTVLPCLCFSVLVMFSYVAQHQLPHWKMISGTHLRSDMRSFRSLTEVKVSGGQLTLGHCLGATWQTSLTWRWPLKPCCCHGVSQSALRLLHHHWWQLMWDNRFLRGCLHGDKLGVNVTLLKTQVTMVTGLTGRMGWGAVGYTCAFPAITSKKVCRLHW